MCGCCPHFPWQYLTACDLSLIKKSITDLMLIGFNALYMSCMHNKLPALLHVHSTTEDRMSVPRLELTSCTCHACIAKAGPKIVFVHALHTRALFLHKIMIAIQLFDIVEENARSYSLTSHPIKEGKKKDAAMDSVCNFLSALSSLPYLHFVWRSILTSCCISGFLLRVSSMLAICFLIWSQILAAVTI